MTVGGLNRNCGRNEGCGPQTEGLMSYSFEICRDKAGDYRARFRAPHGQILFTTDGRPDKVAIQGVIDSLRRHAAEAEVDDLTAPDASRHRVAPEYAGHH